jgi:hypothetical protein
MHFQYNIAAVTSDWHSNQYEIQRMTCDAYLKVEHTLLRHNENMQNMHNSYIPTNEVNIRTYRGYRICHDPRGLHKKNSQPLFNLSLCFA